MVDSQYKIRVLIAVVTEAMADRIKLSVQGADDIEIVGIITSAEELVLNIAKLFPKVIMVQMEIADNWAVYVKQINKLIPEPEKPIPFTPDTLPEYEKLFYRWNFESPKVVTIGTNESEEQHRQSMIAGVYFHLPPTATDEQILNTIRTVGHEYISLRVHWKEPAIQRTSEQNTPIPEIQREYRPDIVRVLLAVASESLADDIKAMVQYETNIEIIGVVTSADEVLPKAKELSPNVVCFHTDLHERWYEYVKQIYHYAGEALGETIPLPDFRDPVGYKKWQLAYVQRAMHDISIAVMSPDTSDEAMQQAMRSGARFYLPVSLSRQQFMNAIRIITTYIPPEVTIRPDYRYSKTKK